MENLIVSREKLEEYVRLLLKWNKACNLISPKDEPDIWSRHILDSLRLMDFIKDLDCEVLDIGSGGGLPGIVLSLCGVKKVVLVESNSKKCSFLLQAAQISSNKIEVVNDRVENLRMECDFLTCRALAPLYKILGLTKNIAVRKKYLLLKGENLFEEIKKAQKEIKFHYNIRQGRILEIDGKNICRS